MAAGRQRRSSKAFDTTLALLSAIPAPADRVEQSQRGKRYADDVVDESKKQVLPNP